MNPGGKNLLDRMGGAQANEGEYMHLFLNVVSRALVRSKCGGVVRRGKRSASSARADPDPSFPPSCVRSLPAHQLEATRTPFKPRSTILPRTRLRWEPR